jgi:hypothetical protein
MHASIYFPCTPSVDFSCCSNCNSALCRSLPSALAFPMLKEICHALAVSAGRSVTVTSMFGVLISRPSGRAER